MDDATPWPSVDPDALRELFEERIPFNRVLGLRVVSLREGRCRLRVPHNPRLTGDTRRPALHGGVISATADASGGLAVFSQAAAGDRVSTVDLRIDYLRPGRVDEDLLCDSVVLRLGNRVAVTESLLHHGDPAQPVARATAVYNVVRSKDEPAATP